MSLKVKKRYPLPHTTRPHQTLPQRMVKRENRHAAMRRTATTMLVLMVLAVGAGMGYTWYIGQQKTASASQTAPARTVRPIFKPKKVASDAPIGVATQTFMGDVKAGSNASITVRTNPEAECAIQVKYNNVAATDSGLTTKVADEFGIAGWAWTVAATAPVGKWPVTVSCKNKAHSAVVIVDLIVTK